MQTFELWRESTEDGVEETILPSDHPQKGWLVQNATLLATIEAEDLEEAKAKLNKGGSRDHGRK